MRRPLAFGCLWCLQQLRDCVGTLFNNSAGERGRGYLYLIRCLVVALAGGVACADDAPQPVGSVLLTPARDTVAIPGNIVLTATARADNGEILFGRQFDWETSAPNVAEVSGGTVTGLSSGNATITVRVEEKTATARVLVWEDVDGDDIPDERDACPLEPEIVNGVFDLDGCPDSPRDLYNAAVLDIQSFWVSEFAGVGLTYFGVSAVVPYTFPIATPCSPSLAPSAWYCTLNAGVYYHDGFMGDQLIRIGDMAPVFILAHEIGHHVENLLGFYNQPVTSKQLELGADCLGGAYAASAQRRALLDVGDVDEVVRALLEIGDPTFTWFQPGAHGTGPERVAAFRFGLQNGTGACVNNLHLFPPSPPAPG